MQWTIYSVKINISENKQQNNKQAKHPKQSKAKQAKENKSINKNLSILNHHCVKHNGVIKISVAQMVLELRSRKLWMENCSQ